MQPLARRPKLLLVGKPNSGKTLLFNRLTGLNQKVANFPGVTVEVKTGSYGEFELLDLPGIYSLTAITEDEVVAIQQLHLALEQKDCAALLCVLDATRLERSLVLGLEAEAEARKTGTPVLYLVNMADELSKLGLTVDVEGLSKALGREVHLISARTSQGLDTLTSKIQRLIASSEISTLELDPAIDFRKQARSLAERYSPSTEALLDAQSKIDRFTLHSIVGILFFILSMSVMFQAVFTWAEPLMNGIEYLLGSLGVFLSGLMPTPLLGDFVKDAILAGISAVAVFIPQIALLTFMIGLLEDSGYLARAATLCHRPLSAFGLSGKSFVPLLSGHACAIPAIMASRTIESPRARWLTLLAIPLMSCSARLPVYGLLIATVIPDTRYFGGLFGLRGFSLLLLYLFGIFSGLLVSAFMNKYSSRSSQIGTPLLLELPPYRIPAWKPLLNRSLNSSWQFVRRAGSTVFFVSIIVWILGYFPHGAGHLDSSYLAVLGKAVAPIFAPIGIDWKITVAVLSSFLAREVFVGTTAVLFGIDQATERSGDRVHSLQQSGFTLASGVALLVFFAVSLQCVSTLAVLRKETRSSRLPIYLFAGYSLAAYVLAIISYNVVPLLTH